MLSDVCSGQQMGRASKPRYVAMLRDYQQSAKTSLAADDIWVACFSMDRLEDGLFELVRGFLLEDELARAALYRFDQDRNSFVFTRGFLKSVLSYLQDMDPVDIRLRYGLFGKPELVSQGVDLPICFNVSHTRKHVACVFARTPVGIDVEDLDRSMEDTAYSVLSEAEIQLLEGTCRNVRNEHFLRIWTMKEAALKALGTGLSTPLDTFTVEYDPPRICGLPLPTEFGDCDWKIVSNVSDDAFARSVVWFDREGTNRKLWIMAPSEGLFVGS